MTERNSMECAHLVNYLFGELSDRELVDFQRHASHCSFCQKELHELFPVHRQLTEDDTDIPDDTWFADQKQHLLQPTLSNQKPSNAQIKVSPVTSLFQFLYERSKRIWWSSAVAVVLVVGASVMGAGLFQKAPDVNQPVRTLNKVSLAPNHSYPNAQGVALVVNNHDQKNLILTVSHVPIQSQWGCYDVWGLKDGKYYSLGEFTVDQRGNGGLSLSLPRDSEYDSIEITLEPAWGDNEPQGPQVLTGPWAI